MTWRVVEENDEDGHPILTLRDIPEYVEKYINENMATVPEGTTLLSNKVRMPVALTTDALNQELGDLFVDISRAFTKPVLVFQPARLREKL